MATQPTNLPVPSESALDLKFNAGKVDEFVTSFALKYKDRLGGDHYTIEGLRQLAQQAIAAYGWVLMDSFQAGATLTLPNQVLRWKLPDGDGDYYRWDGELPKVVPAASTPESTGGIGAGKWLSVGDAVLRTELSESDGSTLVGGSSYVVDSFDDALHASAGNSKVIITRGHTTVGIGSATYIRNDSTGAPSTGNELSFYDASGSGWTLRTDGVIDCRQFGVKGDGTNETVKVQLWLDCCAEVGAEAYIPSTISPSAIGVVINSNHNGLKFNFEGFLKFYGNGNAPVNKPTHIDSGACYCLYLDGVSEISGFIRIDGNRADKQDLEQVHCIGLFGGSNHNVSYEFKECQGDGIYLNQLDGNSNSAIAKNINIPFLKSSNSNYFGRNAMSVISVDTLTIGIFISLKHGGVISNVLQPCGFDIEPNYAFHKCTNISISSMYVETCGGGFTVFGKSDSGNYVVRDVMISSLEVVIEYVAAFNAAANSTLRGIFLVAADGVSISSAKIRAKQNYATTKMFGAQIDASNNISIPDMQTERIFCGALVGGSSWSVAGNISKVNNITLNIKPSIYQRGLQIGDVSTADFRVNAITPALLVSGSDVGVVQTILANGTGESTLVKSTRISVSAQAGITINWGIYCVNKNIERENCLIYNSDLTAIPHNGTTINRMIGTANFQKMNIAGVTPKGGADTISGTDIWGVGDVVNNNTNAASGGYIGKVFTSAGWKNYGLIS